MEVSLVLKVGGYLFAILIENSNFSSYIGAALFKTDVAKLNGIHLFGVNVINGGGFIFWVTFIETDELFY